MELVSLNSIFTKNIISLCVYYVSVSVSATTNYISHEN